MAFRTANQSKTFLNLGLISIKLTTGGQSHPADCQSTQTVSGNICHEEFTGDIYCQQASSPPHPSI